MVFADPLSVLVTDRLANRLAQVQVRWMLTSGSVILGAATTDTGSDGIALVNLTGGPSTGPASVTAALGGGSPSVVFHVTVVSP
jgi:hypothetical protein